MKLEDNYKNLFENHQSHPDSKLWEQIEERLEPNKKANTQWLWLAASVVIVMMMMYTFSPFNKQTQPLAQQIKVNKIEMQAIAVQSKQSIKKVERIVPQQRIPVYNQPVPLIALNKIAINQLETNNNNIELLGAQIVHVKFSLKGNVQAQKTKLRPDNPIEGVIELAIHFFQQKKKQLNLPIIEIDYTSLLTLNQDS